MKLPRIGVFDSGVGGLTVLKAMAQRIPAHYLYFGDTARLPYGTKSAATVARYAVGAAAFLESQQIEFLVIACNTATALALPQIEASAHVPVVGVVDPGAAMAAEVSTSRAAVVIATDATVSSHAYRNALKKYGLDAYEKACPLLVPLVEEGWIEHPVTEQVARIYLDEALAAAPKAVDVLVLACTHYPLLTRLLRRIVPAQMHIVDSAESTARVVQQMLEERRSVAAVSGGGRVSSDSGKIASAGETSAAVAIAERGLHLVSDATRSEHPTYRFFVTDSVDKFKRLATRFLGRQVDNVEHVDLGG